MRAVIVSIGPEWCEKIGSRKKSCEIRKTRPKLQMPFKCYIYCTSKNPHLCLMQNANGVKLIYASNYKTAIPVGGKVANGKVIGEFVCDRIEEYTNYSLDEQPGHIKRREDLLRSACMTLKDWRDYIGGCPSNLGYAWHISELVIYDTPKAVCDFFVKCDENCADCDWWKYTRVNGDEFDMECSSPLYGYKPLKRPPQSWCYVKAI